MDCLSPHLVSTKNNKIFSPLAAGGGNSFPAIGSPWVTQMLEQTQEGSVFLFLSLSLFYSTYPEFYLVFDRITTLLISVMF